MYRRRLIAVTGVLVATASPALAQQGDFVIEHNFGAPVSHEVLRELEDAINVTIGTVRSPALPRFPAPAQALQGAIRHANRAIWPDNVLAIMWGADPRRAFIDIGRPRGISALHWKANRFQPVTIGNGHARWAVYETIILYALLLRTWEIDHRAASRLVPIVKRSADESLRLAVGGASIHCLLEIRDAVEEIRRKVMRPPAPDLQPSASLLHPCRSQ